LPFSHGSWSGGDAGGVLAADGTDPAVPRFEAGYAAQTRGFVRAIIDDQPVAVTGPDGVAALKIALAADQSVRQGQPVAV